ncbi:hypothetical protein EVAR_87832_1 [Eumeta japonica]|uniref:Uncharacterized protein n=1 Tax=Eumeta variegata TaxID=151549 RepID=A0A4C1YD68_EUMVA|nr:hypothetical protein EVAR_87832_1 [Eumeta japonica]
MLHSTPIREMETRRPRLAQLSTGVGREPAPPAPAGAPVPTSDVLRRSLINLTQSLYEEMIKMITAVQQKKRSRQMCFSKMLRVKSAIGTERCGVPNRRLCIKTLVIHSCRANGCYVLESFSPRLAHRPGSGASAASTLASDNLNQKPTFVANI